MQAFIVDAFTNTPFKGNPAGVCIVESALSNDQMLQIAQELNLSETAFLQPLERPDKFSIRYFSPKMEIPLCGHATLGSAKILFQKYGLHKAHCITSQGIDLSLQASGDQILMEFPIYVTKPADVPPALLQALGIEAIQNAVYNRETNILLVEISDSKALAALNPDFIALYRSHDSINGVLVTAPGHDGYDYHLRYFWPWSGTNEDPVTGGIQTFLAPYWAERLGKTQMRSFQSSARTGFMELTLSENRVIIRGEAVIVLEGQFLLGCN